VQWRRWGRGQVSHHVVPLLGQLGLIEQIFDLTVHVSLRYRWGAVPGAGSFTVNYLADCAAVPNMRIIGQNPQKITKPLHGS
jgi:hypothetical protein